MEKQENSKIEDIKQGFFNKTTVFLTKFIFGDNFDMLKKLGFKDSYICDPDINSILTLNENQRFLFLLFNNDKMSSNNLKKVINDLFSVPCQIVFSYELVNDYCMIVLDFPEKHISDYDNIVKGSYSKLSDSFKDKFPISRDVFNSKNIRVGKERTIYYHIFNKTEWLKNFWMEKLDLIELDDKLELWQQPGDSDLIFDIKKLFKN